MFSHRHAVEAFKHFAADKTGYVSDDSSYSNLAIVRALQEARSNIVKQRLRNKQDLSEYMVQTLTCIELKELDRNEISSRPDTGCKWLKSVQNIPEPLNVISFTGDVVHPGVLRFNWIEWDKFQYIPAARIRSNRIARYYTYRNIGQGTYLYVYNDRFIESLSMSAIFEDPMLAEAFENCEGRNEDAFCNPLDVDFYTDVDLRKSIYELAWQSLIPVRQSAPADIISDNLP